MAIAVRSPGSSVVATGSQTSLVVPVPAGVQNGDVLIMAVYLTASSGTITDPAGWTSIASNIVATSSASSRASMWWRLASSEPASYTVTTGNGRSSGGMIALTGAVSAAVVDASANAVAATAGLSAVAPSVSPAAAGLLVTICGGRLQPNATAAQWAPAAGQTEHVDASSAVAATSNSSLEISSEQVAAGATGTRTATASVVTAVDWIAFSAVIKPAAGGASKPLVTSGTDGSSSADAGPLSLAHLLVESGADGSSSADAGPLSLAHLLTSSGADGSSSADGVLSKAGQKPLVTSGTDGSSSADAGPLSLAHLLVESGADGSSSADGVLTVTAAPIIRALAGSADGDSSAAAGPLRRIVGMIGSADGIGELYGILSGGHKPVEPVVTPIGPGQDSVGILLWAADPTGGRWDLATWDGAHWAELAWQSIGCDVGELTYRWGASQEAGILSVAEAGELDLQTIDPDRELDPLNASSPFYGYVRPGSPVRIVGEAPGEKIAATAYIDAATYDVASARGRIRAIDGIAYLSQVQLPEAVTLPDTLRARVRAIVAAVGLASTVPVEPEAPADPDVDPPVAPHDGKSAPAWAVISKAAQDALVYVWVDPTGMLRFRSWGALPDAPFAGIGCPPADADPAEQWLLGLSTIETTAAGDAVRNSVRAYSSGTTWAPAATDGASIARYGPRPFDVDRVVPDRATWASRILADRSDAGLEIAVGQLRPYTVLELGALLDAGLAGPSVVRVRDDAHGDLIDLDLGMIGATVGMTPAGWRWQLVTALSRVEWDAVTPEPPIPPTPPADPWHVETRSYIASSDALIALSSGGAKYGAGAASTLPVGAWSGWTYRSLLKFPSIPWTKVRAIRSAKLNVRTTTQVRVGFGSSPKTEIRRITENWSAGSASSPSSGNAVVWPGPATTSSGEVSSALPSGQNVDKVITITALVKAWAPATIGGSGAPQYGLRLGEYSGSTSNTGEVWPVEQGGAARPSLDLELEVFD